MRPFIKFSMTNVDPVDEAMMDVEVDAMMDAIVNVEVDAIVNAILNTGENDLELLLQKVAILI
jgi:hypothetical protein